MTRARPFSISRSRSRWVVTAPSFVGSLTDDLTVEFSNGWTGVFTTKEHFAINTNANGNQVQTNVHQDSTPVRDQNGVPVGVISFRVVEHFTFANGSLRVDVVNARLTCDF
jgi:hypothetical protein